MRRTLLSRRWLGFLVLSLVVAAVCVRLGFWQLHRFQSRSAANARVAHNTAAAPVPVGELLRVGADVRPATEWRRVTATGRYDVAHQLLVRQRPLDGANGYEVLTPLVTDAGPGLVVDRGWVPAGESATATPSVPAPPQGTVTVTGRVRASEPGELRVPGMPARQVRHIAVGQIDDLVPYRLYGGYVQLTAERPAARQPLTALPVDEQPTALNLAYTVQWWLFAGIALVGWWFLARREALEPAPERRRTHEEETQHVPG